MTRPEFDFFLLFAAGLCVVLAIANAFRSRSRGPSAYFLSGACLAFGAAMLLYRADANSTSITLAGVLAFAMLIGDFVLRARGHRAPGAQK
jgi:hypothetical protein